MATRSKRTRAAAGPVTREELNDMVVGDFKVFLDEITAKFVRLFTAINDLRELMNQPALEVADTDPRLAGVTALYTQLVNMSARLRRLYDDAIESSGFDLDDLSEGRNRNAITREILGMQTAITDDSVIYNNILDSLPGAYGRTADVLGLPAHYSPDVVPAGRPGPRPPVAPAGPALTDAQFSAAVRAVEGQLDASIRGNLQVGLSAELNTPAGQPSRDRAIADIVKKAFREYYKTAANVTAYEPTVKELLARARGSCVPIYTARNATETGGNAVHFGRIALCNKRLVYRAEHKVTMDNGKRLSLLDIPVDRQSKKNHAHVNAMLAKMSLGAAVTNSIYTADRFAIPAIVFRVYALSQHPVYREWRKEKSRSGRASKRIRRAVNAIKGQHGRRQLNNVRELEKKRPYQMLNATLRDTYAVIRMRKNAEKKNCT